MVWIQTPWSISQTAQKEVILFLIFQAIRYLKSILVFLGGLKNQHRNWIFLQRKRWILSHFLFHVLQKNIQKSVTDVTVSQRPDKMYIISVYDTTYEDYKIRIFLCLHIFQSRRKHCLYSKFHTGVPNQS